MSTAATVEADSGIIVHSETLIVCRRCTLLGVFEVYVLAPDPADSNSLHLGWVPSWMGLRHSGRRCYSGEIVSGVT